MNVIFWTQKSGIFWLKMLYFLRFPQPKLFYIFPIFFYPRSKLRKNISSFSGEIGTEERPNYNKEENLQISSTHLQRKSNETNRNATTYLRDNKNDSIQTNPCK